MEDRSHPEFEARNDAFLRECETRGWWLTVVASTRSTAEQYDLRLAYLAGAGNYAADPYALGAISPWGWQVIGSMHQIQADGYSHAKDYRRVDAPAWPVVHDLAYEFGIGFYIFEPWQGAWWSGAAGIFPVTFTSPLPPPAPLPPKDDDMTYFVQADDGDIAVFLTDFVSKSWVPDGNTIRELIDAGLVKAALDATPIRLTRATINAITLIGQAPQYGADYTGPRTT